MEIVFIRHGQGEHNLPVPDRLNMAHPRLTAEGRRQVSLLRGLFAFSDRELLIISPTVRTIETANLLTEGIERPRKFITPLVGPRIFPYKPEWKTFVCDEHLMLEEVAAYDSSFIALDTANGGLWTEGINETEESRFEQRGRSFIRRLGTQRANRAFIVTHDGTITSYRKLLGERDLTRTDFLGEAGCYSIRFDECRISLDNGEVPPMKSELAHRTVTNADLGVISSFPQSAEELFYIGPKFVYPLTPDQLLARSAERASHTVVIDAANRPIAYANLYDLNVEPSSCWLGNVMVSPDHRGQGVAAFLLDTMMKKAREEQGMRTMKLYCHNPNTRALLFYTKMGFRPCVSKRIENQEGRPIVAIEMVKELGGWIGPTCRRRN
ncbi:GNAT family N-acetyltransferase [Cohnella thermotolerans]|uniref:GNAT family N-acetyltransferase n=1 Tax=Cohnella thermotolerans TaxID=329858 RepID=UPI0006865C8B|nr:GNAT family N-acetyltransferase [Cohnella thermotolerans]